MANWERRQWLQRRSVAPKFALAASQTGNGNGEGWKGAKERLTEHRQKDAENSSQTKWKERDSVSLSLLLLIKNGFKRELQRRQLKAAAAHCCAHCGEEGKIAKKTSRVLWCPPPPEFNLIHSVFFNHSREQKNGAKREQLWQLWKENAMPTTTTTTKEEMRRRYIVAQKNRRRGGKNKRDLSLGRKNTLITAYFFSESAPKCAFNCD